MNLINPFALWYLLVIPPVVVLYFMKLRRKEMPVTASFLWDRVMRDARVDSFFQKLRVNILLILQILIILFLISALARPYFRSTGMLTSETIFIIDHSASMGVREGNRTRLELAREKIDKMLNHARPGSRFMIIEVSNQARILSGFTDDISRLRQALSRVRVRDTGSDLKSALLLATSLMKSHPGAGIILVGDGLPEKSQVDVAGIPRFEYVSVGSKVSNMAITTFDISGVTGRMPGQVFIRVENFSPTAGTTQLEMFLDENLVEARQLEIPPGGNEKVIVNLPGDFSGVVRCVISDEEGLHSDNQVWAVVRGSRDMPVLLVADEGFFLERLLILLQGVSLEKISPGDVSGVDLGKYELVIWVNCRVPSLDRGNHCLIGCETDGRQELQYPAVISWDQNSPILRFVDLSELAVESMTLLEPPPEARILVSASRGPMIHLLEKPPLRTLHINFDLMKSNWPLQPSFPIFFWNLLEYMAQRTALPPVDNNATGQTMSLDFVEPGQKVRVRPPGQGIDFTPKQVNNRPVITLDRAGLYRVTAGETTYLISANLLDPKESQISPAPEIQLVQSDPAKMRQVPLVREIWWELALTALLILVLEWFIFNRRRT